MNTSNSDDDQLTYLERTHEERPQLPVGTLYPPLQEATPAFLDQMALILALVFVPDYASTTAWCVPGCAFRCSMGTGDPECSVGSAGGDGGWTRAAEHKSTILVLASSHVPLLNLRPSRSCLVISSTTRRSRSRSSCSCFCRQES